MNNSRELDPSSELLYLNFNQTSTALCVGAKTGYTLYDFTAVYECEPSYESIGVSDICIIERNFSTSLVAYVALEKPRNLVLYNLSKGIFIVEKLFPNTVLSVKLNRRNVAICLEDCIYIMNVMAMSDENTHVITNTPINAKGLIALSYGSSETSILAYPGSSANGDVQIFDALQKHAKITIPAHTSPLAAMAFDEEGERIATASVKGTVIRVFSVSTGEALFEFRRGVKRCVEIQSLSFCKDFELLCASSNTETIHIFKLCHMESPEPPEDEAEGWMEMFGRVLTQSAKYLPTQMSDVLTQQRSFAFVHLPFVSQKTICAITTIKHVPYILVASLDGFLYIYDLNTEVGGPCHLVKQHKLQGPRLHREKSPVLQNSTSDRTKAGTASLETKMQSAPASLEAKAQPTSLSTASKVQPGHLPSMNKCLDDLVDPSTAKMRTPKMPTKWEMQPNPVSLEAKVQPGVTVEENYSLNQKRPPILDHICLYNNND